MNFYEVLGVDEDADREEVRRAFRGRARRYHPDVNEHPQARQQFQVLNRARDVLADPGERNAYDRLGHADYVDGRLDGRLPTPDMDPRPGDERADVGDHGVGRDGDHDSSSGADTGSTEEAAGGEERPSGSSTPGASEPGSAESTGYDAPDTGPSASESSATGGTGSSTETDASTGSAPGTATGSAQSASSDSGSGGESTSTKATSTPPPGAGVLNSTARGPRRVRRDQRREAPPASVRSHLAASHRWLGVLAAAAVYLYGLVGYLDAAGSGIERLVAALTSSDPTAVAAALRGERYGVPDAVAYAGQSGAIDGPVHGGALLVGAVLLPIATGYAVVGLRRRTTWRPTWVHVLGTLGPVTAVGLAFAAPSASVPLLLDLALLAVVPAAAVASFLLNRLVVVAPLRRREDR